MRTVCRRRNPIKYTGGYRHSDCRAWLVAYDSGERDVLLTATSMEIQEVVRMVSNHYAGSFNVMNITVGAFRTTEPGPGAIHPDWYQSYYQDARKVNQDLEVEL